MKEGVAMLRCVNGSVWISFDFARIVWLEDG
jgi:hypothetical protein